MDAMEEQWIKNKTDCVYFLASPFTCKKGIECEYRHSEIARLNPRDCWYWLAGNCLNPYCTFRHPPFEGPTENGSVESVNAYQQAATSLQKTNVPCYFFFNGSCSKGEKCLFLHGPFDNANLEPPSVVDVVDVAANEIKAAVGIDRVSDAQELTNSNEFPRGRAEIDIMPKVEIKQSTTENILRQTATESPSLEAMMPCRSTSDLPAVEFSNGTPHASDRNSADQVDSHTEVDYWLESSPGFDVLVDNSSEELGYGDDSQCFQNEDGENNAFINHLHMSYNVKDVEFDLVYPDSGNWYDHEDYSSSNHSDNENPSVIGKAFPGHARDPELRYHLIRKRKLVLARPTSGFPDLRDYLKKPRLLDGCYQDYFSRRNTSQHEGRYQQSCMQHWPGKLASKMVSDGGHGNGVFRSSKERGRQSHSNANRSRKHLNERRQNNQQLKSIMFRKGASRRQRSESSGIFESPKSLAQIREEKRKPKETIHSLDQREPNNCTAAADFQGPKSLGEILKEKHKVITMVADVKMFSVLSRTVVLLCWTCVKHLSRCMLATIEI